MDNQQPTRHDNRQPVQSGGFDANRPTIISLLYLASMLTGITGIVGIILAHVWRGEGNEPWVETHLTYLIRTFWFGFLFSIIAGLLTVVLIGFLLLPLVGIWFIARSVMSFMKAQRQEPMPDPQTLMF